MLFLVEKNRNAVFRYYGSEGDFRFNPNSKNILIGVTLNNEIITFSQEQFEAISKATRKYDFKMNTEPSTPSNIQELKKCISYL